MSVTNFPTPKKEEIIHDARVARSYEGDIGVQLINKDDEIVYEFHLEKWAAQRLQQKLQAILEVA